LRIGVDGRELQGRPTGTGRYLRNLLRAWPAAGDQLVVYFNGAPPPDPVLRRSDIDVRPLGDRPVRGMLWQQRRLPIVAAGDELDVFFSPAYTCPLRLDVSRVTAIHDLSYFSLPWDFTLLDGIRRRALVALSIRASRRVLACSEFSRREILARFPQAHVSHVALGADDDLASGIPRAQARRRLGLRGPLLLTVGAILNRRRVPALLQAVARLLPRWPDLRLDIVGENRTHPRLDVERLSVELGLAGHVRHSGFVSEPELATRYAAADVAVSLSEYEGFGLPALEALSRRVPLVIADRPAQSEIFGEAAITVEPSDPTAVSDAIGRLLSDPALARDYVERGLRLARRFSWKTTAALTRSALLEAV